MREWSELASAIAWPVVVFLIVVSILIIPSGRELLSRLFGRISRLRGGGFEVELTPEKAREVKEGLDKTILEFRTRINRRFDREANTERVTERLEAVYKEVIGPALLRADHGFKATVYVQDILFKDVLYRLVDYYPRGGGRGKTYSMRYGIIGKVWRTGSSDYQKNVPADSNELIETWGMTLAETVQSGPSAKSFVCVVMRDSSGDRVGLLFIQSEVVDAFLPDIVERLEGSLSLMALSASVDKVIRTVSNTGQYPIAIFDE